MNQLFVRKGAPQMNLLPVLTAGLIAGIICIANALAFATLIFSGPLSPYVGIAAMLGLITCTVGTAVVALGSSQSGSISPVQEMPAIMLTLTLGAIAQELELGQDGAPEMPIILATVIATVALCTLLNGGLALRVGSF